MCSLNDTQQGLSWEIGEDKVFAKRIGSINVRSFLTYVRNPFLEVFLTTPSSKRKDFEVACRLDYFRRSRHIQSSAELLMRSSRGADLATDMKRQERKT